MNSDGEDLGPFDPTGLVTQLKRKKFSAEESAKIEGESERCSVREALRRAGLTPDGRELSTKLRPQESVPPQDESDAKAYFNGLSRRRRSGYTGTRYSQWSMIRRAGVLVPLVLGFTLAIPWFSLGEGIIPIKGYYVMMGLHAWFVVLLIVMAAATALISLSNGAYLGGDAIDIATAVSAALLVAALWMIPLVFLDLLDIFIWGFGGGLQLATAVLALTAACAIVPLRRKRGIGTDVAIIVSSLAGASGIFFLAQGIVFLLRY